MNIECLVKFSDNNEISTILENHNFPFLFCIIVKVFFIFLIFKKVMKKLIIITVLLCSVIAFSQEDKFDYEQLSNTNPKNELSKYLKDAVPRKYLKKARFLKNSKSIILSFKINKDNKPFAISISTSGSYDLKKALTDAFKKYPLKKLNIGKPNRKNKYSLQIISKKGNKPIFNVSSKIIIETTSIHKKCSDLIFFDDIKTCINLEVKKHIYKSFDFSKLKNTNSNLLIQFIINKNGELINKKSKIPSDFKLDLENALKSFPKIKTVSTINGSKIESLHCFSIPLIKGELPVYKDQFRAITAITKPTTTNSFSKYLSNKLSLEIIKKADLNRINRRLSISFELNKNNEPFNLTSNARSQVLESKIFALFKKYPITNFNIIDKHNFNKYGLQILSFENDDILIKTSTILSSEKSPIFPGCENSLNRKELKKCFSKGVQMHFIKKFDASLPNKLGLSKGRKRIFIGFKIDRNGDIVDVKVKAPHPTIIDEVKKVMYLLPKIIPGKQTGKNVNVKYSIPFTLLIE